VADWLDADMDEVDDAESEAEAEAEGEGVTSVALPTNPTPNALVDWPSSTQRKPPKI
jgi:hypothetical protein